MTGDNGHAPSIKPEQLKAYEALKEIPEFAEAGRAFFARQLTGSEEPPADPWKPYTLADAYQERPPLQHVAGKLFELPSLNIVYGAPGTLKSFLLQDLAISVAAGQEWLTPAPWKAGGRGIVTKRFPVMWLDFDNGARRTHNRFEALGRARKLAPETPITYYSMPNPWLSATKPESIGMLTVRIKAAGAKLVIIDNLGNVSGDAEENSSEMGAVMSQFRQIAEETGAAVVLIHHQRKSNGAPGGRVGDALRGHSSIEAALDLALLVEREPYSESITIKATKVRGAEILPFAAQFTYEAKDDDDLLEARFFGLDSDDNESDTAIRREILAALTGDTKLNKKDLTAEVKKPLEKIGQNRIRTMIDRMAAEKQIKVTAGDRTERLYSL